MFLFIIHLSADCYLLHRTKSNKDNIVSFLIALLYLSQSIYISYKELVSALASAVHIVKFALYRED